MESSQSKKGAYTVPKPAERVSRLSTSDGYSHPSGPQLQTIQEPQGLIFSETLLLVCVQKGSTAAQRPRLPFLC